MVSEQQLFIPHPSLRLNEVPAAALHLCGPTVLGYSFSAKRWGRFAIESFKKICWSDKAFDHLVLSKDKKDLIESLVYADQSNMVSDVISSKAGGFIIILYGKPGTGKTLTAEAAAEKRKCPLMIVSAAELGYQADQIESKFRNILYVCRAWNAILLIDEAEVYLEARSLGNLQRNAMVSIFLRLLEYHQLIIFLTTNHISRLDTAIKSRVAVAIKYPDLDRKAREEIWTRFLTRAGVQIIDDNYPVLGRAAVSKQELRTLSDIDLNGR